MCIKVVKNNKMDNCLPTSQIKKQYIDRTLFNLYSFTQGFLAASFIDDTLLSLHLFLRNDLFTLFANEHCW